MARQRPKPPTPHLPETVRRAVGRTVESTRGSARSTRGRAQDLVDDATRIFEHQAGAAAAVPERVRGAIDDLRFATREDLRRLGKRIDALQDRVDRLEGKPPRRKSSRAKPRTASKTARKATGSKRAASSNARKTSASPSARKTSASTRARKPAASRPTTSRASTRSAKKS